MASAKSSGNDLKTVRDTLESIWVAIVLAFVLRAFVVEAFVIPTGSMAPRLYGQHYSLRCPACGYDFAFGADGSHTGRPISNATCPNCGYSDSHVKFDMGNGRESNGGDRVLVLKYLYQIREPQRWDVVVFLNPQDNRTNYIKRLIGLPGETIEIVHGDIFTSKHGKEGPFKIQRKPARAQDAMWQIVFDNDCQPNTAKGSGGTFVVNPPRWNPTGWTMDKQSPGFRRVFQLDGGDGDLVFVANRDWFRPMYGYNGSINDNPSVDVCTDLKLSTVFVPQSPQARLSLQSTNFDYFLFGDVCADGSCRLRIRRRGDLNASKAPNGTDDLQTRLPAFQMGKACQIALTHADMRLTLWVDGKAVLRTSDEQYDIKHEDLKKLIAKQVPEPEVRISAQGKLQLRHLQLMRDVYYTSPRIDQVAGGPYGKVAQIDNVQARIPGWGTTDNPITLSAGGPDREHPDRDLDEFFVMGDNSPNSLDSRLWTAAAPTLRLWKDPKGEENRENLLYHLGTVPRYSMKGKAMFVYWPAGFRAGGWPLIPNVGRMRLIR